MKIYELSSSYTPKQVNELNKQRSMVYKTEDNKVIFVSHGNEAEEIENKWLGDISKYDDICVCYANPEHRIMYHGWYWDNNAEKNYYGNTRIFLFIGYDYELSLFFTLDARKNLVKNFLETEE